MKFPHIRVGRELEKTNEYFLPNVGEKIDLYHKHTHRNGRFLFSSHEQKIGEGSVNDVYNIFSDVWGIELIPHAL